MSDAKDARKHKRFESQNLLEYILVDEKGNPVEGGMGRTLNVSEGGMLMETTVEFDVGQTLWILIGVEEDMVEVEGVAIHIRPSDTENRYVAGIDFKNLDKKSRAVLEEYLARFNQNQQ
mgnify:FL=1